MVFVSPQLVSGSQPGQRLVFPCGVIAVDQVEAVGVQYEETAVDQPLVSGRLLHEARDPLALQLQRTEPSGRLHRGHRGQTPMLSVERDGGRDVYVGQAVSVRHAELVLALYVVRDTLQASARERALARIDERDPPRLGSLLTHVDRVVFEVEGDVGHVEREVGEVLLDHVAAVAAADDEVVHAMGRVHLHDVPQHRSTTDFDHGLGP